MEFANINILWGLVAIPLLVAYYVWRQRQGGASIIISTTDSLRTVPRTLRYYLRHAPFALRMIALSLLVIAAARPQSVEHETKVSTEGIDIVMALDISGSMLARDFQPDRLTSAKRVASEFISTRTGDRIGLVVFAGEAFTQSPLTTDQSSLQTLLGRIKSGVIEDGTAIGNGLATALNRLRESDSKSKVVILLTDGVNNRGQISPLTAAEIAKEQGIKVYTIGVGRNGEAPYPVFDERGREVQTVMMKVEIDEDILRKIASETGGEYFRATDELSLTKIYEQINSMEKSHVEKVELTHVNEEYLLFVVWALTLLIIEFILKYIILKRIP
ncbi:MAG: VWA domain-containing protein [Alistipes sp.]|nr:VWA domain-containing protein [Alistipes sp.]